MKTVIYGGTFDPPHIGHTAALASAVEQLEPERVLVIPSAEPPHKSVKSNSASGRARMEMTALAMEKIHMAQLSDVELSRGGKSYTVDTLSVLREQYMGDNFTLLMGTDMAESFETWKNFREIIDTTTLGMFTRGGDEEKRIEAAAKHLSDTYGAEVRLVRHDAVNISSTEIRALLSERGGREYLDEKVYAYIIKNRLYGAKADFRWLREQAYAMLEEKRIPHVAGTEEEAVRLAERWNVDVEKAREAAILHDITKKEDYRAQLILCERYGIIIDDDERKNVKLLHSKTGAAVAKAEFGVDDDVYSAIKWHTTGKEDMTMLEKVIYISDYIEPTRDFEGLDKLRALAYTDIDAAVLLGLEMSIEEITERGIIPHIRTREAAKWLREHSGDNR